MPLLRTFALLLLIAAAPMLLLLPTAEAQDTSSGNDAAADNADAAPTEADLRYRFADGQSRLIRIREQVRERTIDRDRTISQRRDTTFDITERVTEVLGNGSARLALTYDRVRFLQETDVNPNAALTFDSNNEQAVSDPALKAYEAIVGKSFSFVLSAIGEVTEVQGYSELLDEVFADLAEEEFQSLRDQLRQSYSNEAMARELTALYRIVPTDDNGQAQSVQLLDRWQTGDVRQTIAFVGQIVSTPQYELQSIDTADGQRTASVEVSSGYRMEGEPAAPFVVSEGVVASGRLENGSLRGSFAFNLNSGRLSGANLAQEMTLYWSVRRAGEEEDGEPLMEVTSRTNGTITLEEIPAATGEGDNTNNGGGE